MARNLGRTIVASMVVLAALSFPKIHAQSDAALLDILPQSPVSNGDQTVTQIEGDDLLLPQVEVTGGALSWRLGLRAYHGGDYPQAEQHFRSFRNQLATSVLRVNDLSDFRSGINQFTGQNIATNFNNGLAIGRSSRSSFSRIREHERKRAGLPQAGISQLENDRAQASYAVGASLIKQNKFTEAKRYFSSAIGQDHTLHDARLRLGLIALFEDNVRAAERRLQQLERWCDRAPCDDDSELAVSVQTLRSAIVSYAETPPE